MHILNDETGVSLSSVTLLLDRKEIEQLISYEKQLVDSSPKSDHHHHSSSYYQKEITICLIDPSQMQKLNSEVRRLLEEDGND